MNKIPEAVVVDTATGDTWFKDATGQPFTLDYAERFASQFNESCKPEHRTYVVRQLVPVGETRCTACGGPVGSVCWRCA